MQFYNSNHDEKGLVRRTVVIGLAAAVVISSVGIASATALDNRNDAQRSSSKVDDDRGGKKLDDAKDMTDPDSYGPNKDVQTPETPQAPEGMPELPQMPEMPSGSSGTSHSSGSYSSGWSSTVNGESHGNSQQWTYQQPGQGWQQQSHRSW